jgi:hypothetical protein
MNHDGFAAVAAGLGLEFGLLRATMMMAELVCKS